MIQFTLICWLKDLGLANDIRSILGKSFRVLVCKNLRQIETALEKESAHLCLIDERCLKKHVIENCIDDENLEAKTGGTYFLDQAHYFKHAKEFLEDTLGQLPSLLITDKDDDEIYKKVKLIGINELILLPFTAESLRQTVQAILTDSSMTDLSKEDLVEGTDHTLGKYYIEFKDSFESELDLRNQCIFPDLKYSSILNNLSEINLFESIDGEELKNLITILGEYSFFLDAQIRSQIKDTPERKTKDDYDEKLAGIRWSDQRLQLLKPFMRLFCHPNLKYQKYLQEHFFEGLIIGQIAYISASSKSSSRSKRELLNIFLSGFFLKIGELHVLKLFETWEEFNELFDDIDCLSSIIKPACVEYGASFFKKTGFKDSYIKRLSRNIKLELEDETDNWFYAADFLVSLAGYKREALNFEKPHLIFWLERTGINGPEFFADIEESFEEFKELFEPLIEVLKISSFDDLFSRFKVKFDAVKSQCLDYGFKTVRDRERVTQIFSSDTAPKKKKKKTKKKNYHFDVDLKAPKVPERLFKRLKPKLLSDDLDEVTVALKASPSLAWQIFGLAPNVCRNFLSGEFGLTEALEEIGKVNITMMAEIIEAEELVKDLSEEDKGYLEEYHKKSLISAQAGALISEMMELDLEEQAFFASMLLNIGELGLILDRKSIDPDLSFKDIIPVWESSASQMFLGKALGVEMLELSRFRDRPFCDELSDIQPLPPIVYAARLLAEILTDKNQGKTKVLKARHVLKDAAFNFSDLGKIASEIDVKRYLNDSKPENLLG